MNIPGELVTAIASGNAVLFIGAGLSVGAGLPGWGQLISPLADRLGLPDHQRGDLIKIAQFYENQRGRHALISYIQEQTDTNTVAPTANHRRLARLGIRTWVTTNFDDLLEQTLRDAGERVAKVVRDHDLPYIGADRLTLIKLHGDRAQPETMVITRQDYNTYTRRSPRLKEKLSSLLVEKTFLLIGYSISDPDFNQLLDDLAFDLQQHRRMAFAVLFDADALTIDDLRARTIQVLNIPADPPADRAAQLGALLDALILNVEQARRPASAAISASTAQSAGSTIAQGTAIDPPAFTPQPPLPNWERGSRRSDGVEGEPTPNNYSGRSYTAAAASRQDEYMYDAFISYNPNDGEWVETILQPQLERAGLRLCLPDRDFEIGVPRIVNMERAVERSRKTLLILTPNWGDSQWTEFEGLLAQTSDPIGARQRLLPLIMRAVALPSRLAYLTSLDLTDAARFDRQIGRLIDAIRAAPAGRPAAPASYSGQSSASQSQSAPRSSRPAPPDGDGRLDYERGLRVLGQHIPADGGADWMDFNLFKDQLANTLAVERRYGPTESTRAERSRVIDNLNPLALSLTGLSFTDLCLGKILAR